MRWAAMKRSSRPGTDRSPARADRSRRAAALRAREVVSRRASAALGAELLLAGGWRAGVGERGSHRARRSRLRFTANDASEFMPCARAAAAGEHRRTFCQPTTLTRRRMGSRIHSADSPQATEGGWRGRANCGFRGRSGWYSRRATRPSVFAFRPMRFPGLRRMSWSTNMTPRLSLTGRSCHVLPAAPYGSLCG